MQRLIFNGFMVVLARGGAWAVLYYSMFFAKVQETLKPP
jgi:hypothetical protein